MTVEGIKKYAKNCMKPGIDYYDFTFNNVDGDLYRFKKACEAAEVFDPYYLSSTSKPAIEAKLQDLVYFDHRDIFTPAFIGLLIEELPTLIGEARNIQRID